jgi:hypothetical protein
LFVADLYVAPYEKVKEFTVGPDFSEAKLKESAGRLDSNGDGGAGGYESNTGLRDGSHAFGRKLLRVD